MSAAASPGFKGGFTTLCGHHYQSAQRKTTEPHPGFVAAEILPPEESLDSAQAVNAALTRIFRLVAHGELSVRHATSLAYVSQLIISTLPQMEREAAAAAQPTHQLLGADPDAALADLAHALRGSVRKAAGAGASAEPVPTTAKSEPPDDTEP